MITDVLLNQEPTDWFNKETVMKKNSLVPQSIHLTYDENHLTFKFNGISFSAPELVRYKFILEGFDDDWSPITKHTEIAYTNIPPGDYTFKVKSMNKDGVWDENPDTIHLSISPPFWQTWLFRIIVFILLIFGLYEFFQSRLRMTGNR